MTVPMLFLALTLGHTAPDTTLRLPRNGAVEIDTRNRDVIVRTGASDIVTVRGGSAELDGGTLQIGGDERRSRGTTAIEVTLPTWARVEVNTLGGNLTFTGAPDRLNATTVNGFIHLTGGTGTVELETVAGAVVVNDFHGTKLAIDATGGPVTVTNATGTITVDEVNSSVSLRGIRSMNVTAGSVNGPVEFEGPFLPGGRYDFNSQNNNVTLILPADVSARMKVSTMNGELMTPQIPATTTGARDDRGSRGDKGDKGNKGKDRGGDGEHTFTVVYGSGAASVTVDVFNGNVVVKKKP